MRLTRGASAFPATSSDTELISVWALARRGPVIDSQSPGAALAWALLTSRGPRAVSLAGSRPTPGAVPSACSSATRRRVASGVTSSACSSATRLRVASDVTSSACSSATRLRVASDVNPSIPRALRPHAFESHLVSLHPRALRPHASESHLMSIPQCAGAHSHIPCRST